VGADISVKVKYAVGVGALYCVIDLAKGSSAASYPVTYLNAKPSEGFHTTEYKTTKLVLKRVDPGSFTMANSKAVTLTKSFYMGLYEVTQKQWNLVTGSSISKWGDYSGLRGLGDAYPAYGASYNAIRGTSKGAKWPASNSVDSGSFLGKLRERTKLDFDLPTEAQWEYTCRAGTTTAFCYGDSVNGDYMWYQMNSGSYFSSHEVGTKLPNKWDFYDMHGNVWEWCLDRYNSSLSGGEDPVGPSSGSNRVRRGGSSKEDLSHCASYWRDSGVSTNDDYGNGFRLSRTIP
jgi:formylglycine-generating enzyme required for sulfatase activity